MKILVTGGAGFIGSHVVSHYQGAAEVVVLDNFRTGHRSNLEGMRCSLIEGSILDAEAVEQAVSGAGIVIHLAAMVSVPESMESPVETVRINVTGLLNVLEASRRAHVRRFILASSAAVYGENPIDPKVESLVPDPRSPYAITKLDGEYYCSLYDRLGWLSCASLRFFNVFGPRQDPGSAYGAAVPRFLFSAKRNLPLTIFGDGRQTRDFVHVEDIAGALAFVAENSEARGVFNVGYGRSITILDLANEIRNLTGSDAPLNFGPSRPGDIRCSTADPSLLLAAGWRPRHSVMSGLATLV